MPHPHQAPVMQGRADQSNSKTQSQQSLLIGSAQASVGSEAGCGANIEHICYLCEPIGSRHYARKGDLTRHIKTVHGAPSRFLCHILQCPRSIAGGGFARKDKLVDHLESSKPDHGLSHQEAVYQAAVHNTTPVHGVSQASPLRDPNQNAVQSIHNVPLQGTVYGNVAYNPTFQNAAASWGVFQGIPSNHFHGHAVNEGVLSSTYNAGAEGQANFNNAFIGETDDGVEGYLEHDLPWH